MFKGFDLAGKVALISGGNGGIGLGMARGLAQAGADVVIWGTNGDKNARAEHDLAGFGTRVMSAEVDVTDESAVAAAMHEAIDRMGQINTVIANAGTGGLSTPLTSTSLADFRKVEAINLEGSFLVAREACRHWIARQTERANGDDQGGSLVLIGSVGSESGMPRFAPYAATKAALEGLMRSILVEHARYGVRVNLVQPGFVRTDMTAHFRSREDVERKILAAIPMKRWGTPEEFAGIAVYLASDASAYQSGSVIHIDGGYLAS